MVSISHNIVPSCMNAIEYYPLVNYADCLKCLYNKSSLNHGTLGFFKSKLNRMAVKKMPKDDVDACLDFLLTLVHGNLLATALLQYSTTKQKYERPSVHWYYSFSPR